MTFSNDLAVEAARELRKAGLTDEQIAYGGLAGTLRLASAGGMSPSEAARVAAVAVDDFILGGAR